MNSPGSRQSLQFVIPARLPAAEAVRDMQPAALQAWLGGLPLANAPEAARQILERLQQGNRARIEPLLRYQAAEALRQPVEALVETINARYLGAALPLSPRNRVQASIVQGLLEEMCAAYKIVIMELQGNSARSAQEQQALINALPRATAGLGQLVLETYLAHAPETPGRWHELHSLYLYAEQSPDARQNVDYGGKAESAQTLITQAYLRIALLALANPYHLMPGEALTVYRELANWANTSKLITPDSRAGLTGKFIVDLAHDAAPCFLNAGTSLVLDAPRIIDAHNLVDGVEAQIKALIASERARTDSPQMGLAQRMRRDMLLRLKHAWGGRAERKLSRANRQSRVYLTIGLSASHYFIAGEVPFLPERDEVRLHRGHIIKRGSGLSLVPKEHEPWKLEEQSERMARDIDESRASHFDTDSPELDIWYKIHSATAQASKQSETAGATHITKVLRQVNQGAGGICLSGGGDCGVQTRVGELIAYKSEADPVQEWRIGMIRWLRCMSDNALDLGIMRLADEAVAIAMRCIEGVGKGGEYFRALHANSGTDPVIESLITPAAIYDIGSVMVINTGQELSYIRLTKLIETTNSFSQFAFEPTHPPESEVEKITSIKTMRL